MAQSGDADLVALFAPTAKEPAEKENAIMAGLAVAQGAPTDTGV